MSYTAVYNSNNYIVHMNQNHDKKGRFTYGDGDGDGISNDHANQKKKDPYALEKVAVGANVGLDTVLLGLGTYNLAVGLITQNYARVIIGGLGIGGAAFGYAYDFVEGKRIANAEKTIKLIDELESKSSEN